MYLHCNISKCNYQYITNKYHEIGGKLLLVNWFLAKLFNPFLEIPIESVFQSLGQFYFLYFIFIGIHSNMKRVQIEYAYQYIVGETTLK